MFYEIKRKNQYKCTVCGTIHDGDMEAEECCSHVEELEYFVCPFCFEDYETEAEAEACCLYNDNKKFGTCKTCLHCDENGKHFSPCTVPSFSSTRCECFQYEPDYKTFGTQFAEDYKIFVKMKNNS